MSANDILMRCGFSSADEVIKAASAFSSKPVKKCKITLAELNERRYSKVRSCTIEDNAKAIHVPHGILSPVKF